MKKKLTLHRETLRRLSSSAVLQQVKGAVDPIFTQLPEQCCNTQGYHCENSEISWCICEE